MKKRTRYAALELQALRTIRKHGMFRDGERVLVATSGGADSMALLHCLHHFAPRFNLKLIVAHFNHGLRGEEADKDEEFVRAAGSDLGWPFLSESVNLKDAADRGQGNLEEMARVARYEFLWRSAGRAGADKIATGHNLNDQAETFLLHLLRGSGPAGLAGIRPVIDGRLVRPLLECSRQQILRFLATRNIPWREDSTNQDMRYQRNRIRHELIPYLAKNFNPRLLAVLAGEAEIAYELDAFLEDLAGREFARIQTALREGLALPVSELDQMHPALRRVVVRRALRQHCGSLRGIERVHVEDILRLCRPGQGGRRIELPGGMRAWRDLDAVNLTPEPSKAGAGFECELTWPGHCRVPAAGMEFRASLGQPGESGTLPRVNMRFCALLDPDSLPPTLLIRSRLPGDRYGGREHRKVKRMLLAARIPLPARTNLPMVVAGDVVIWVPGFLPAKFFRAKPDSGRFVLLEAKQIAGQET